MLLAVLVLLSGVANTEAADLDLLEGGVSAWSSPSRVSRCPVHSKIQPVAADGGKGVSFVVNARSGKRFSISENYMPAGGLGGYGGIQFNFTSSGLGSWKLRIYDGQSNIRFSYIINKPDGAHSLTLPWSSFRAENVKKCNTNTNGYSVKPSSISHLAVVLGKQSATLTLQGMHAMRDTAVALSAMALAPTVTGPKADMAEGYEGPFVAMGITGHNDFPVLSVNSPAECAKACTNIAKCRSFDYGARGRTVGECWLSLADRQSASYAYTRWELYNYYEKKSASSVASMSKATGVTDSEMALSKDDVSAVMGYFDGPFVGMGITGYNDFELLSVNDPSECAEICMKTDQCRSIDYGSSGRVVGECWMSRANRESVGSAYKSWPLYTYYEIKGTSSDTPMKDPKQLVTPMEGAKKDATPMEDEKAAAKKNIRAQPSLNGSGASHAQRLSPTPMAFVQAVGALVICLAW